MKYGNGEPPARTEGIYSMLHPSQNHGMPRMIHPPRAWEGARGANDRSNEGIIHVSKPFFSVQFHPEARAGLLTRRFYLRRSCDTSGGRAAAHAAGSRYL